VCVCVRACVCATVRVHVYTFVCVCVCWGLFNETPSWLLLGAVYNNKIVKFALQM